MPTDSVRQTPGPSGAGVNRRDFLTSGLALPLAPCLAAAAERTPLDSPVGRYKPELLLLAPEKGEDAHALSLVSQFLELGVPIELDANWRIPTAPPRDLSSYKACLFPESARERYDADLDAFYRKGGFLGYFKYYPVETRAPAGRERAFLETHGRDLYFFHMASVMAEGGLTLDDPGFASTLRARSVRSMIDEYRRGFFARFDRPTERWTMFGDPAYTMLQANHLLAEKLRDPEWRRVVEQCLQRLYDGRGELLSRRVSENQLDATADVYVAMMGCLLIERGTELKNRSFVDAGVELVRFFIDHSAWIEGALVEKWQRYIWSESMMHGFALHALARQTGDRTLRKAADATVRKVIEATQHASGLWHHWADARGHKGALWSRASQWPLLWMTQSLYFVEPDSESADMMHRAIRRTFDGLAKHLDRSRGIWHLVVDEPATRLESTATSAFVYCYDRLRELDRVDRRHQAMLDLAFEGLKRLYYRGGTAAVCRGTASGPPQYYRTRPIGYSDMNLFTGTLAPRSGA
jgi:rhamnogalacturonyl hydrolase YesR